MISNVKKGTICRSLSLSKFKLIMILVSLIAIISNFFLVQLKRCWRSLKFLLREHAFIWNSDSDLFLWDIYISWKKLCSRTFKASSEEVIEMRSQKMKPKYLKEDMWKSFFCKLTGWHLATLLQINFFTYTFQGF